MVDAVYGCDTCRTTIGRAGCPTHCDRPAPTPGVNIYITHCIHGLDLRLNPRCYLCRPELPPRDALDVECPECGEGIRHQWPCSHVERCDEPGCDREADCGWPTKAGEATFSGDPESDGYRRTCGPHMRWAAQSKEPSPMATAALVARICAGPPSPRSRAMSGKADCGARLVWSEVAVCGVHGLQCPPRDALDVERLARVDLAALIARYGPDSPSLPHAIAREYAAQSKEPTP